MKRRLILGAPIFLLPANAWAQAWAEYRTYEGRFYVQMPGAPDVQTSTIRISKDETAPLVEATVRQPGATYQVSYIAYPRNYSLGPSADALLDHFRDKMTAGHTVTGAAPVALGRVQGRAFTIVESPTRSIATRLFIARNRLFQLTVTGGPGIEAQPNTRKFLESFDLIPQ